MFFVCMIICWCIVTNKFFLIILKIISLILSKPLSLIIVSIFLNEKILKIFTFRRICWLILKNMCSEFVLIISSFVSMKLWLLSCRWPGFLRRRANVLFFKSFQSYSFCHYYIYLSRISKSSLFKTRRIIIYDVIAIELLHLHGLA